MVGVQAHALPVAARLSYRSLGAEARAGRGFGVAFPRRFAARRLVEGVIAAGSYKKFVRLPLQDTLNLLSLAQRGKLATTDPVMKSLVGVDNHVVWNVLTYWAES